MPPLHLHRLNKPAQFRQVFKLGMNLKRGPLSLRFLKAPPLSSTFPPSASSRLASPASGSDSAPSQGPGSASTFLPLAPRAGSSAAPLAGSAPAPISSGIRVGFNIRKKTGKAVLRNRLRRLLRAVFQENLPRLQPQQSLHLVLEVAPVPLAIGLAEVRASARQLFEDLEKRLSPPDRPAA